MTRDRKLFCTGHTERFSIDRNTSTRFLDNSRSISPVFHVAAPTCSCARSQRSSKPNLWGLVSLKRISCFPPLKNHRPVPILQDALGGRFNVGDSPFHQLALASREQLEELRRVCVISDVVAHHHLQKENPFLENLVCNQSCDSKGGSGHCAARRRSSSPRAHGDLLRHLAEVAMSAHKSSRFDEVSLVPQNGQCRLKSITLVSVHIIKP